MARISKTARVCCYPIVSFGLTFAICKGLEIIIGSWAFLLSLPIFFYFNLFSPVDSLDLWLRRRTKDDYWLMSNEGKKWLDSKEGEDWLKTEEAQSRLATQEAESWANERADTDA
jgi:hypothetical protein